MLRVLFYLPLWLLGLLAWVMLRTRAYRECPFFFSYVVFGVAADVTRLITRLFLSPASYPAAYWATDAGYCILGILAMYEVVRSAVQNLPRAWWAHLVLPMILITSVGLSFSRSHVRPIQYGPFTGYILVGEIAVRFVQVFAFAGLATLRPLIGLRLRRYSFGVAMGFGLYATVMLMATSRYADLGRRFAFVWGVSSVVAYSVAVSIWIWFFWAPAEVPDHYSQTLGPVLH